MTNDPQIALIILRAVEDFDGKMNVAAGKQTISKFLYGSKSKTMILHSRKQGYGALYWQRIDVINGYLDQLREMGHITTYRHSGPNWSYYALVLTEAGRKALEEHTEIPLQDRHAKKQIKANESIKETQRLLRESRTPEQIAASRNLALSTIYTHCHALIATGELRATTIVPHEKIVKILQARKQKPRTDSLKEIKDILPDDITYGEIRCVLADTAYLPSATRGTEDS